MRSPNRLALLSLLILWTAGCDERREPPVLEGPLLTRMEPTTRYLMTEPDIELQIELAGSACEIGRPPEHGELTASGPGLTYRPAPGYRGTDSFVCGAGEEAREIGVTVGRYSVPAVGETAPITTAGDNADDMAVWVHPTDPASSLIVGANNARRGNGAILLYDLEGREVASIVGKRINNVDVRYGFPLGGRAVDIAAASNRTDDTIVVFEITADGEIVPLTEQENGIEVDFGDARTKKIGVYGFCLYRSPESGKFFGFITAKTGFVAQVELFESLEKPGRVTGSVVRTFDVNPGRGDGTGDRLYIEGCVVDDHHQAFYVGEEDFGIWRYGAEPNDGDERRLVDRTGLEGHLVWEGDVEGLAIYRSSEAGGYLIASNQGDDSFNIYDREGDNRFLTRFEIVDGEAADGVIDTDGIDVLGLNLGGNFTSGIFLAQDYENTRPGPRGNQNFKMARWHDIATGIHPNLAIRDDLSPR